MFDSVRSDWSTHKKLMFLKAAAAVPAVEDTATGNPLTFQTDLARPLKSLLIPFTPVQSGTGDPSPQNIRSILPWNGLKVWNGGKNLLKASNETLVYSTSGYGNRPTYTENGIIAVVPEDFGYALYYLFKVFDKITSSMVGTKFVYSSTKMFNYDRFVARDEQGNMVEIPNGVIRYQDVGKMLTIRIYVGNVPGTYTIDEMQVEIGNSATTFEPYSITETDISFQSTVYGGEHEAVSGKLMDGWKVVDMGSLEWTYRSGDDNFTAPTPSDAFDMISSADIVNNFSCEAYKGVLSFVGNNVITMNNRSTGLTKLIRVRDQSFGEDAEAFTAFVTGKKLAYKLATPTEQTLTGHQITALVGDNTIWSDADGSMTAVYLKKG